LGKKKKQLGKKSGAKGWERTKKEIEARGVRKRGLRVPNYPEDVKGEYFDGDGIKGSLRETREV